MPSVISKIKGRVMNHLCCSSCPKHSITYKQPKTTLEFQRDVELHSSGIPTLSTTCKSTSPTQATVTATESEAEERRLKPTEEKIVKLWERWGKRMDHGYKRLLTSKQNHGRIKDTGSFKITDDNVGGVDMNGNASSKQRTMNCTEDDPIYQNLPRMALKEIINLTESEGVLSTLEQCGFKVVSTPVRCVFEVISPPKRRVSNSISTPERCAFDVRSPTESLVSNHVSTQERCAFEVISPPERYVNNDISITEQCGLDILLSERSMFNSDYLDMSGLQCDVTSHFNVKKKDVYPIAEESFYNNGHCDNESVYKRNIPEVKSRSPCVDIQGAFTELSVTNSGSEDAGNDYMDMSDYDFEVCNITKSSLSSRARL